MRKSEARRAEILEAAYSLFFEKGYEATTVRMIMRKVGCEMGLFYYYFENKDDLFDAVLDRFFERYREEAAKMVEDARRDPFRALNRFFEYMTVETLKFRERYAKNMHRTIRWSIREQTLTIITPYLQEILEILVSYGAKPQLSSEVLGVFLAHGVGSFILHEDEERFPRVHTDVKRGINLMMGLNPETAELMFPYYMQEQDLEGVIKLVEDRKKCFPGLASAELARELSDKVQRKEAFVIRHNGRVVGCVAFSIENKSLDLLVTATEYQNNGIGTRLFITAMAQFPIGTEWSVVILREGERQGEQALRFCRRFGFHKTAELEVNGYPCQRMSMTITEREQGGPNNGSTSIN